MAKRQIVAMGGGGFSVAGDDGVLDDPKFTIVRIRSSRAVGWLASPMR